jgi:hypothetical protein
MVKFLPSKCEVLNSIPNTTRKQTKKLKKKKKEKEKYKRLRRRRRQ